MSKEYYDELWKEHIPYEMQMLTFSYYMLEWLRIPGGSLSINPVPSTFRMASDDWVKALWNTWHENFCLHAYNLYGVLRSSKLTPLPLDKFFEKVDEQVLTLTRERTADNKEKINWPEHTVVFEWINTEYERKLNESR